jgi:hypothetical protein
MASHPQSRGRLERFAVRALASLRKELKAEETADTAPPRELPPPATTTSFLPRRLPARNEQRHAEIHELMTQGLTVSAIARRVRLDSYSFTRAAPFRYLPERTWPASFPARRVGP